jgi:hypothetical protein
MAVKVSEEEVGRYCVRRPPDEGGFREGSDYIKKRGEMSLLHNLPDVQAYPV